jgi:hypothetical protein
MIKDVKQEKVNSRQIKKDKELFRFVGKDNKMINVQLLDEVHEEKTVRTHLFERDTLKSIVIDVLNKNECDYNPDDLESIRSEILKLLIINPKKHYADAILSEEGYIERCIPITDSIIEVPNVVPTNIDNGCYKVIEYKPVLDEEKLKQKLLLEED